MITRTVWILSIISFLTDTASELLYPVMPIYLQSIGFSMLVIGLLEGMAEATTGLSKGYFGKLSDTWGRRAPFIQLGYTLSSLSRPMLGLFTSVVPVFLSRTLDRLGKGMRTGARDAMLSDEATPQTRARVFGFHRAMDTLGAAVGPLLALVYLSLYPQEYRTLFLLAFIPGILAIAASLFIRDKKSGPKAPTPRVSFFAYFKYRHKASIEYKRLVLGLALFTLFNSSDVFLLLKAKECGLNESWVIGVYIFYNLVYALFSFPMGILADRLGMKAILILGFSLFALVYWGMSFNLPLWGVLLMFLVYGLFSAATEGVSKAWISNVSLKEDKATALGAFSALQSICSFFASLLAGMLWAFTSPGVTFGLTGVVTIGVVIYFWLFVPKPSISEAA